MQQQKPVCDCCNKGMGAAHVRKFVITDVNEEGGHALAVELGEWTLTDPDEGIVWLLNKRRKFP